MKKIKKEKLVYLWSNTIPLFNVEAMVNYSVMDDILAAKGDLIFYVNNGYHSSIGKKKILDKKKKFGDMFLQQDCFDEHVTKMNKLFKWREKLIKTVTSEDLSKYSNARLLDLATQYHEIFARVLGHMVISRPECVDHLSERLISLLSKYNKSEADKLFATLVEPTELDIIKKEQLARLKLFKNPKKDLLKKHLLNFPWLYAFKYTMDEALCELKNDLEKENFQELADNIMLFKTKIKKLKKEKSKIKAAFNNPEINLISERLSFLGHNRLEVKSKFAGFQIAVSPLFEEIAKRNDLTVTELLDNYLLNDFKKLLLEKTKLSKKDMLERKTIVFYTDKKRVTSIQGKEAENFAKEYLQEYLQDNKDFVEGMIASKGFVVGKARKMILSGNIDLETFKSGEILITEMTAPNMVPVMKKCAGVITNEGGIVSHAAIMSREFGIPCIVGTGTATQVFETGDYIELDAVKGIARKITEEKFKQHTK